MPRLVGVLRGGTHRAGYLLKEEEEEGRKKRRMEGRSPPSRSSGRIILDGVLRGWRRLFAATRGCGRHDGVPGRQMAKTNLFGTRRRHLGATLLWGAALPPGAPRCIARASAVRAAVRLLSRGRGEEDVMGSAAEKEEEK